MAMTVLYNSGAQLALSTLNKNNLQANKSLLKLASGEKFVGAQGESASYAISEKMREQIRSLYQDEQNVQNGSSLVRTAERGIDQIIENLRTMKELAIDAANDSNTDEDRHTIQKELEVRRAVIDDIALGTKFNSKVLLDGRYGKKSQSMTIGSGGKNTTIKDMKNGFIAGNNAILNSQKRNGGSGVWRFDVDKSFASAKNSNVFEVELNFSTARIVGTYPNVLSGQGFCILCGGCEQYINVLFDASKTTAESIRDNSPNPPENGGLTNNKASEFIIGVKNVGGVKELANAIFEGIAAANNASKSNNISLDRTHDVRIRRDATGKVFITKNGPALQFMEGTIPNPAKTPISPVRVTKFSANPLWIQHGTQAGQRMHIDIENMQSKALGINAADVMTRENANDAIGIIDNAIETTLNEATNMGAYLQRLEVSYANIVTMNENTQGSESTIRDADMAKEITEYMKYNLLSQSAQAMLTQANTDGTFVLGLLQ